MKRKLRILLLLILFASNFNNVRCQQANDFNRLINMSLYEYIHDDVSYYRERNWDTMKTLEKKYIEISNYPPDFKLNIHYDIPTYFALGYNIPDDMRKKVKHGYTQVVMFDIVLCKDTMLIGFNKIYHINLHRSCITDNNKSFLYTYDNINQKWDSLATLSGWRNFNHRGGEFLHNDLYDLINESLYSYIQSPLDERYAINPSNGFYLISDGMPTESFVTTKIIDDVFVYGEFKLVFLDQKIKDLNCVNFAQEGTKYSWYNKDRKLPAEKGFDAVSMENLVLHGDTLQISYVWRHVKLQRNKTLSVETDLESKRTFYYKYSSATEKWELIKED